MSGPNGEPSVEREEGEDVPEEEYVALNLMLDQINSCLDNLEEKNDVLNAKFRELLESNRQVRLEFQQQQMDATALPTESKERNA
uniref:bublin coiled-coil protein n=1 Tax=Pristiophorus japonicus TaxID=55135 RepID=UPI00398F17EB